MKRLAFGALIAIGALTGIASDTIGAWTMFPIYGGGCFKRVEMCPSAPNVLYTYVDMGGPYRSDDGGKSWRPLFGAFSLQERQENDDMVRDINVDPRNADNLLVAGGNRREVPGGIFVTRDGGKTFRRTVTFTVFGDGEHTYHGPIIARNPQNPDEIFAGEDMDGLFHSADNGETWTKAGSFTNHWFTHIRYDKTVPGRLWATAPKPIEDFRRKNVVRQTGFYRSDDNGRTWHRLPVECPPYRLAQATRDPAMIASWETSFKRSVDGGETWTDYSQGLPKLTEEKKRAFFLNDATFKSLDAGADFYLAAPEQGELYRRDLGDNAWRVVPRQSATFGCPEGEDHIIKAYSATRMWCRNSFTVDPTDSNHWFTTDWYDVWETKDAGANWTTRVKGMMPLVTFDVKCDPNDPSRILYGVADVEMLYSKDGGKRFYRPRNGNPYANCLVFSSRTKHRVAGCGGNNQTLSISEDGGITWKSLADKSGLPQKTKWYDVFAYGVAFDPLDDTLYAIYGGPVEAGKGGVYRSQDGGETWTFFSEGLPAGARLFKDFKYTDGPANQLVFSSDGSGILRAPKIGKFYRLDRDAGRWVEMPYDAREEAVPVPDPFVPGRFLLPGRKGVRESLDGGLTFHPYLSVPKGPTMAQGIAFDPHRCGRVAVATYASVCLSDDGGLTWRVLPGGLDIPTGSYRRIVIDRDRLFFITNGCGVWMRQLKEGE